MANEINIQASITMQKFTPAMQCSGSKDINQTNSCGNVNVQSLTTSTGQALQLGGITSNLGYLFVKNLDQSNNVQLTLDSNNAQIFALIRPNEFCLVPVSQNTIYGKAVTSTANVMVAAAQT